MDYAFPSAASEFVYTRSYARWLEEEGRRETWDETVDRYISFIEEATGDRVPQKVFRKARQRMMAFETFGSMRLLWSAGKAAAVNNIAAYNCAFQAIDCIEAFAECLFILMSGAGYGFSIEHKYVDKLPTVERLNGKGAGTFIIPDSKEGWADSVKHLMRALYAGNDLELDYSLLRPKGARLKTMGGKSSGAVPLIRAHDFIRQIFKDAQGRKLKPIECLDILNKIADIVVVGGVRRASQISLSDLEDQEVANAKTGNIPFHREMSNNSTVYHDKPGVMKFMEEWVNLAKSGRGERGIFNIQGAKKRCPERRDENKIVGVNPCQPDWALLMTTNGLRRMHDINIGSLVWSGESWCRVTAKACTGIKPVYCYSTSAGRFFGTEQHQVFQNGQRVEARLAESIDVCKCTEDRKLVEIDVKDVMDGLVLGDGSVHHASNDLIYLCIGDEDYDYFHDEVSSLIKCYRSGLSECAYTVSTTLAPEEVCKTYERVVPERFLTGNYSKITGFLRGLFSANGGVNAKGQRVELRQTSKILIRQVQDMLSYLGIRSYITTDKPKRVKFSNGDYDCKQSYKLNITSDRVKFKNIIGFIQRYKVIDYNVGKHHKLTFDIHDIEYMGDFSVYDISVETNHSYWTSCCLVSNCCEILLRSKSFCNLSEVVTRPTDDLDDILDKIETATWLGAIQSTFTHFPYISRKWKNNCEQERLLGVSITGQMDNPKLFTADALLAMKQKAIKVAKKASAKLGINFSAAVTCVKPSGTLSQVAHCSSGIHSRLARWIIRRYRISAIDALYKLLKSCGVPMSPENKQRESDWKKAQQGDQHACTIYEKGKRWTEDKVLTWVVSFPIEAPKGSVLKDQMTAIEQLEYYKKVQKNWCEHNASVSIQVADDAWFEVGNWVYQNWKYITGVSFIPENPDYEQMPEESITEEEYKKLKAALPVIDYSRLAEFECEDNTTGAKELACGGGKCDIN